MTSRERVRAALRHEAPDRVPIDFGAMRSTGIMAMGYNRLKRHLGLTTGATRMYDVVQQLAQPEEAILDRFGVDAVDLGRAFLTEATDWKPWALPDGSAAEVPAWFAPEPDGAGGWEFRVDGTVIGRMPAGVAHVTQVHWPLAESDEVPGLEALRAAFGRVTWAVLKSAPWHLNLADPAVLQAAGETARRFRQSTDRAIMVAFGGNMLENGQYLRGFGQFLEDLALRPRYVAALLDRLVEHYMSILPRFLEVIGPHVDLIQMGDDLGMQTGPQISPRMYREIIKPRHQALYRYIREHFDGFLFLHSCGSIRQLLPDLIEAGVQVVNPVQTAAAGMDPAELKREFGRDLAFWGGGCDTQGVLQHGTPEEVRAQVRERIRIFGEGAGHVFNQVHNVLSAVPPENVVAMFEAAQEG